MRFPFGFILVPALALAVWVDAQTQEKQTPGQAKTTVVKQKNPFASFKYFSATINGGIADDHDRKIYRSGNFVRLDFADHYRITDLEKQSTSFVSPAKCNRVPFPDAGSYPFSAYRDFTVTREMTPEIETVDGHSCAIENVTFTNPDNPTAVIKMKLWEASDLQGFPIRIEVEAIGRKLRPITYTNVNLTSPDPALFKAKCPGTAAPRKPSTTPTVGAKPPAPPPN